MNDQDKDFMVRTVMGEAGDEPDAGKAAVAHVILNRLKTGEYGDTARGIVTAPGQFEPWQTRRKELLSYNPKSKEYQAAKSIVDDVVAGKIADPTSGATHFLAPDIMKARGTPNPDWARGTPVAKIGGHSFFAPNGPAQEDILGGWGKTPQVQTAQNDDEDLLGSWGKQTEIPNTVKSGAPIRVIMHMGKNTPAEEKPALSEETMSEATNRLLREHQGDSWSDLGVRLGAGAVRGVGDVADTLSQGIATVGAKGANALQGLGVISPQTASNVEDWRSGVFQKVLADRNAFDALAAENPSASIGRLGGQIVGTAPFLGAAGIGARSLIAGAGPLERATMMAAGTGAGANALTSAASDEPIGTQMLTGGLTGAVLGPLGYGASAAGAGIRNALFGRMTPEAAKLADTAINKYGVKLTAGQISPNPLVRFTDSVLQRIPFSGYAARTADQEAALSRAITSEMGIAPRDAITRDAIQEASKDAYKAYDAEKAAMGGPLTIDHQFHKELTDMRDLARATLEPPVFKLFNKQIDNVLSKVKGLSIGADQVQSLTRKEGQLNGAIEHSKYSPYAEKLKNSLDALLERNNPKLADLKKDADYRYFVTKSIEPLAKEAGATGRVSPAKIFKALDYSSTPAGQIGDIAKTFIKEPASSGTMERFLAMGALGAGGATGAYYLDPEHYQRDIAYGLGSVLGGRAVSSALRNKALTNSLIDSALGRSGGKKKISDLVVRAAPAAALTYRGSNALASQ
jgi:Cell Wall Hydrolase